eukprot:UN23566
MVVESPKDAQDVHAILTGNKNRYMLMPCAGEKYFTIQLTEDVIVDTVTIVNHEHYSSNFRNLTISGAQKNPTTEWKIIRRFEADNIRQEHIIGVEPAWVRFVRFNITSYYGSEYYCPVSKVQVF